MFRAEFTKKFRQLTARRVTAVGLAAVCASVWSLSPLAVTAAFAQQGRQYTDTLINRQFDWVIYLDVEKLDRFLDYKHSSVKPVYLIKATYRWTNRNKRKPHPDGVFPYEDLYFFEGKVLGSHRYEMLPFQQNEQGCIWIRPQPNVYEQCAALTSSIVRMVLDVYRTQTVLAAILVPFNTFDNFISQLGLYQFFTFEVSYPGGPGQNMSIHVGSDPKQIERYLYYDDAGR